MTLTHTHTHQKKKIASNIRSHKVQQSSGHHGEKVKRRRSAYLEPTSMIKIARMDGKLSVQNLNAHLKRGGRLHRQSKGTSPSTLLESACHFNNVTLLKHILHHLGNGHSIDVTEKFPNAVFIASQVFHIFSIQLYIFLNHLTYNYIYIYYIVLHLHYKYLCEYIIIY